jgi:heptosyltransferase-1
MRVKRTLRMTPRNGPPLARLEPRHIGLLKPSALGDIVHSLPVLTALRRRFPQSRITWVVHENYEPLLRGHPHLDATLSVDRGAFRQGWWQGTRTVLRFLRALRQQDFDLVLDLQGLLRTGLMAVGSGAPRRVGLSGAREGAPWFYTDIVAVPESPPLHAIDRYWLLAEALGAGESEKEFLVPISGESASWARQSLRGYPHPYLAVAPGARWVTKRWPAEHFAQLAHQAQTHFGGTVLLVGGKDEISLGRYIGPRLPGPWKDFSGQTALPQLAALLQQADVVLANDTGPMHLAAALGRPVVAPYTCTRVELTGPYGRAHRTVQTRVSCQGSCHKHCPHVGPGGAPSRLKCMAELTPERLWPALCEVLLSWENPLIRCA